MASTTTTFSPILLPEQVGDLVIRPLIQQSVAGQVLTTVQTGSHDYRIPVVAQDPSASWTAEGEEIDVSDADIDEVVVTPSKLAGLTVITRELANDSNPAAQNVVGQGIVVTWCVGSTKRYSLAQPRTDPGHSRCEWCVRRGRWRLV